MLSQILSSFVGTLLAILVGGIVWLFKTAHDKHVAEKIALVQLERILATNLSILRDNFEFLDHWINAIRQNRPYSYHFDQFIVNEEAPYKLSNLALINKILNLNYRLRRSNLDLDNLCKSYWDTLSKIDAIQDDRRKEKNFQSYHVTVTVTLESIKKNRDPLQKDMIDALATVRTVNHVRFHSLFGYMNLLFVDVFPTVRSKAIESQAGLIRSDLDKLGVKER